MRNGLLKEIHENVSGHLSTDITLQQVQRRGYWYCWKRDVDIFCRTCVPCSQYFRGAAPKHGKLQDMRTGLHIDLTGPFPRSEGTDMTYICTCICAFTKYAIAIPLPDKSAVTVARAIIENVILKLGCCDVIVTDNGKEFENAQFRELCRGLEILKARTTFYNSRSNGLVERFHRSLCNDKVLKLFGRRVGLCVEWSDVNGVQVCCK